MASVWAADRCCLRCAVLHKGVERGRGRAVSDLRRRHDGAESTQERRYRRPAL